MAGGAGTWWWGTRTGRDHSFRTAVVKRGDLVVTISATGTIEPVEVVDVGAQVAGRIISFGIDKNGKTIDYGSRVEEGTVLAKIDDSVYAADLAVAKAQVDHDKAAEMSAAANVEQMKAKRVQAEADWTRAQELARAELVPRSDFDSSKANGEVAKANVSAAEAAVAEANASTEQAHAAVEKAQRNLAFCTIKSPVRGVIIDRRVNIGQTVVSSLNAPSLFLIAKDLTKMQIWVGVNEADVGRIVPAAPVTFTCDAFPAREFVGTVGKVRLNATMTQNVVMYTVEVDTENPESVLLPYLTANVHFVVKREVNALLVPNAALRWSPASLADVVPAARAEQSAAQAATDSKERRGILWLKDGKFVRPIAVNVGTSDGSNTAVTADTLQDGQEVVVGESAVTSQSGTRNPFVPQIPRR